MSFLNVLFTDIAKETIHLVCAENIIIEKLPSKVPSETARYHLYKFKHTHEGDYTESIGWCFIIPMLLNVCKQYFFSVFIYSMPGYNCSVKERMLYSSCKNPLTVTIANLGLEISKKVNCFVSDTLF